MSRLDDIEAEYVESQCAIDEGFAVLGEDIAYLLRVARAAEVIADGLASGDQDDLDEQLQALAAVLKAGGA